MTRVYCQDFSKICPHILKILAYLRHFSIFRSISCENKKQTQLDCIDNGIHHKHIFCEMVTKDIMRVIKRIQVTHLLVVFHALCAQTMTWYGVRTCTVQSAPDMWINVWCKVGIFPDTCCLYSIDCRGDGTTFAMHVAQLCSAPNNTRFWRLSAHPMCTAHLSIP